MAIRSEAGEDQVYYCPSNSMWNRAKGLDMTRQRKEKVLLGIVKELFGERLSVVVWPQLLSLRLLLSRGG